LGEGWCVSLTDGRIGESSVKSIITLRKYMEWEIDDERRRETGTQYECEKERERARERNIREPLCAEHKQGANFQ